MEESLVKRVMPHSIEAEQSVIGSMLMDRDAVIVSTGLCSRRLPSCSMRAARSI